MSKPATPKSATLLELEALLAKHAVTPAHSDEKTWEVHVSQANGGVWVGWAGFLRTRSPSVWCKASNQGAANRAITEAARLASLKVQIGGVA